MINSSWYRKQSNERNNAIFDIMAKKAKQFNTNFFVP